MLHAAADCLPDVMIDSLLNWILQQQTIDRTVDRDAPVRGRMGSKEALRSVFARAAGTWADESTRIARQHSPTPEGRSVPVRAVPNFAPQGE